MNGILKKVACTTTKCSMCGEAIRRSKTFKKVVSENEVEQAKIEIEKKAQDWQLTSKQKHCHICWSIIKDREIS